MEHWKRICEKSMASKRNGFAPFVLMWELLHKTTPSWFTFLLFISMQISSRQPSIPAENVRGPSPRKVSWENTSATHTSDLPTNWSSIKCLNVNPVRIFSRILRPWRSTRRALKKRKIVITPLHLVFQGKIMFTRLFRLFPSQNSSNITSSWGGGLWDFSVADLVPIRF